MAQEKRLGIKVDAPGAALKPSQCRTWMRRTLAENYPAVVARFLKEGTPSSCSHMRMVTELLDGEVKKVKRKKDSFDRLLETWAREDTRARSSES